MAVLDRILNAVNCILRITENPIEMTSKELKGHYNRLYEIIKDDISKDSSQDHINHFKKYIQLVEFSAYYFAAKQDCISKKEFLDLKQIGWEKVPLENAILLRKPQIIPFMNLRKNFFEIVKEKGFEDVINDYFKYEAS